MIDIIMMKQKSHVWETACFNLRHELLWKYDVPCKGKQDYELVI